MKVLARLIGKHHEQQAEHFLCSHGLALIERNYHCRGGEIDLIMRDGETLVFVEVRFRNNTQRGSACESVTNAKQQKILYAARHFLAHRPALQQLCCRFDVLGIDQQQPSPYSWLKNAFTE